MSTMPPHTCTVTFGIRVKKFHTDNKCFSAEEDFKSDVSDNNQTISYCGVKSHFQKRIAEAAIKKTHRESKENVDLRKALMARGHITLPLALRVKAGGIQPE